MEIYKNWQIRKSDYAIGYYEATNLNDCDAKMKHAKSIEQLKIEIDEDNVQIMKKDLFERLADILRPL
tara:strand:+ start:248 stop:451 length:204 start_codon:yes stop_codon:yes gene_type:complete